MDDFLLSFASKHQRQAWLGASPVIGDTAIQLDAATNFRASPQLHRQFNVVWLYEQALSSYPSGWRLMLDESIRLLQATGYLVLLIDDNEQVTLPEVKFALASNICIEVKHIWEQQETNKKGWQLTRLVVQVNRLYIDNYQQKKWSFAVLAGTKRVDATCRFLQSIRDQDTDNEHEILICGVANDKYTPYQVNYVKGEYREEFAEISKKKNDILAVAKHENICIVHDRYYLDDNFLQSFEQYGYDFDFLTVRQFTRCQHEFPSYAQRLQKKAGLNWNFSLLDCRDYQQISANHYANGGLIIMKKHVAKHVRFDEMLFWNQQEDMALAKRMWQAGITLRVNFIAKMITFAGPELAISFRIQKPAKQLALKKVKAEIKQGVTISMREKNYPWCFLWLNWCRRRKRIQQMWQHVKSRWL